MDAVGIHKEEGYWIAWEIVVLRLNLYLNRLQTSVNITVWAKNSKILFYVFAVWVPCDESKSSRALFEGLQG